MYQPLSSAQQKLVEENHNLIFTFLKEHNLGLDDTEDWYGTAAIGLCSAAVLYTTNREETFSSIAYQCMNEEVSRYQKQNNEIVGLDDEALFDYFVDEGLDLADLEFMVYLRDSVNIVLRELSDCNKSIIESIIGHGSTPEDTAQSLSLPVVYVLKVLELFISRVKSYISD